VENREKYNTITPHPKNNKNIFSKKPLQEKTRKEGEVG